MLTLPLLRKMLNRAGTELKANSKYLCELDSVAGATVITESLLAEWLM